MDGLLPAECEDLARCEGIIARGLGTFIEVGTALLEIRDNRLYRAGFSTFEEYCRQKWSMRRAHANRIIAGARVAENLAPIGAIPTSETQVRPLTGLDPEQQREAWMMAIESAPDGHPTQSIVQSIVERLYPGSNGHHRRLAGPVLPAGMAPDGGEAWAKIIDEYRVLIHSIHRIGGMRALASMWDGEHRKRTMGFLNMFLRDMEAYRTELRSLIDEEAKGR